MTPVRRWAMFGLLPLLAAGVGGVVLSIQILRPGTDVPSGADAAVLFAGGNGERAAGAVELVTDRSIPHLIVSVGNGDWDGVEEFRSLCDAEIGDVEVECFSPSTDSTAGEASTFAGIARERGYTSLIVVTSGYHTSRAATRMRQCFDGSVGQWPVEVSTSAGEFFHEFFGLIEARILDRGCNG